MLKDNLKESIKVGKYEFNSISEVLNEDFARCKVFKKGYELGKYRGKLLVLDIAGENELKNKYYDDFYENESLWSNLYKQINCINEELDGE